MTISLKDSLVNNDSIRLNQKAADWKEAVKLGTDLLVHSGAIEPRYYDKIVSSVEELGPYIILAPGLAMPHARPEDGVLHTAFALVTLAEPVYFPGEDAPVSVLFTLAGADATSHGDALQQLMVVLDDEESEDGVNVDRFKNCKNTLEVLAVIDQFLG